MKKFNLEMLRLTSDEVLARSQMKKITGGYGGSLRCSNWGSGNSMSVSHCSQFVINFYCQSGGTCFPTFRA
jgi:hypothetical protein